MDQQVQELGKQFVQLYYTTLQTNRAGLISLYGQNSIMTYGGHTYKGIQDIQDKIEGFGFQKVKECTNDR